jgi:hypothetical protein
MFRTIIKNESLQNPCARKEDSAEFFCNNQTICLNGYTNTEKFTIVSLLFVKNPLNNLINDDKINFLN